MYRCSCQHLFPLNGVCVRASSLSIRGADVIHTPACAVIGLHPLFIRMATLFPLGYVMHLLRPLYMYIRTVRCRENIDYI